MLKYSFKHGTEGVCQLLQLFPKLPKYPQTATLNRNSSYLVRFHEAVSTAVSTRPCVEVIAAAGG